MGDSFGTEQASMGLLTNVNQVTWCHIASLSPCEGRTFLSLQSNWIYTKMIMPSKHDTAEKAAVNGTVLRPVSGVYSMSMTKAYAYHI